MRKLGERMEEIRKARNLDPFRPFRIRLIDGRELRVLEPYHVAVWPPDRFVHVNTEGDLDIYEASTIVVVEPILRRKPRKRRTG